MLALRSQLDDSDGTQHHFRGGRDDTALKLYRTVLSAKIDMLLWVLDDEDAPTYSITTNKQAA